MRKIIGFLSLREAEISSQYILKVSNASPKWQLSKSPQYISGIAIEGVNSAVTLSLGQLVNLIVEILSVSLLVIGISSLDPTITIPSFAFFSISGWLSVKFLSSRIGDAGKEQFLLGISSNELVKSIVVSSRELYLANKQSLATSFYASQRMRNYRAVRSKAMNSLVPKYVSEITMVIGGVLIAGLQFMIKDAKEAITGIVVFVALSSRLLPALLRIQSDVLQIRASSEATKNFLEEFKIVAGQVVKSQTFTTQSAVGADGQGFMDRRISLKNVTASHSAKSDFLLKDLTLDVEAGEFLAIAGPSGSGKTTLVDVMLGIITPESGSVQISNVPPSEAVRMWPDDIRYVPQDVQLVPGSILQNVMWPDLETAFSDDDLWELFDMVELSDWLKSLNNTWHSQINSLGTNLSGGQKQRLGIARALYSSPKILILDESTSALDTKTEQEIVENILMKMKSITRVVIAHRLSTIKEADKIIYMKSGKIIAHGNFQSVSAAVANFDYASNVENSNLQNE
jgi:ABC-type multidrug transport system fused ATPase/permease subunit